MNRHRALAYDLFGKPGPTHRVGARGHAFLDHALVVAAGLFGAASYRAKLVIAIPISPYVSFGSISTELDRPRHVRFTPQSRPCSGCRGSAAAIIQQVCAAGFDALKMYRLVLKKYLPASLRRSNSLCHSFRSSAETSFLRATKSRISRASPLL